MLVVMLIFLLILLFAVWESKKDLLSPSFLLLVGYIITTICSIYNAERWKSDISGYMLFIVSLGIISFIVGEEVAGKIKPLRSYVELPERNNDLTSFVWKASTFRCLCMTVICIVSTFIVYKEVVRIAYLNFREWGNLLYNFKENLGDNSMNSAARIGMRLTKSIAYISAFLLMNNLTEKKDNRRNLLVDIIYMGSIITYVVQSLLTGSRIAVIMILVGMMFLYLTLRYIKSGYKVHINIKRIIQAAMGITIICILFFNVQELVGRMQQSEGTLDYLTTYLGGSFDLFSQYLRENRHSNRQVVETLSGVVDNLQRYFGMLKNVEFSIYPEFRRAQTGVLIGNTYTGFRNYYNDLGIVGVFIFSWLLGFLFSFVYRSIVLMKRFSVMKVTLIIAYSTYLYCILFHFFTDYFYLKISVGMVIETILLIACTYFVYGRKIKLGRIVI